MPIIKRRSVPVIDYKPEEKANWFENMGEAKPKKPLPDNAVLSDPDPSIVRRAGMVFQDQNDAFNVTDMVTAVRTVRNDDVLAEARARNRVRNRGTAITAMCMDCQGYSRKRVTECTTVSCPLWAFRFGSDPMRKRR